MKKTSMAMFLGLTVLYGCSATPRAGIPVVDSGTPLTPGPIRGVGTPPPPAAQPAGQAEGVITVMTPPEAGTAAISTGETPSRPIQADVVGEWAGKPAPAAEVAMVTKDTATAAAQSVDAPVLALINTAQQQRAQGDLNGAASSLERAQRIAPREPQVLYRLAEIRLMQGDLAQAEQLAQRGLSHSSGRPALQAGLWDLIAETREKRGDASGAAEAKQKSKAYL